MDQRNWPVRDAVILPLMLLAGCLLSPGCGKDSPVNPSPRTNEQLIAEFKRMLDGAVAGDGAIRGAVMMVDAPLRDLVWKGAAGLADSAAHLPMLAADQFRTASIGKMTFAALAMRLVETGKFALNDSIYRYLPDAITEGLHVYRGHDYSRDITIRQLLGHRSGLADYVQDGDTDGDGLPDFLELLIAEPGKFWTPEETIEYTKAHLPPLFVPGTGYHYTDTEYQLLGLICQRVSNKSLNTLYRDLLFGPLGMEHTYMEFYDTPVPSIPGRGLSHVYFGDYDYTGWTSVSADWAGGGLVSTAADLSRFIRAFARDQIFQNAQSKTEMLTWGSAGSTGFYYGLGVCRINFSEAGLPGAGEIYGHEGFPQAFMYYWPGQEVTIVGTLNQAVTKKVHCLDLVRGVIDLLQH